MRTAVARLAALATALGVAWAAAGCSGGERADPVDYVGSINELVQKLAASSHLEFTAEYRMEDGATARVVQRPAGLAFIGQHGRFVDLPQARYLCWEYDRPPTCRRVVPSTQPSASPAAGRTEPGPAELQRVVGHGFTSAWVAQVALSEAVSPPARSFHRDERTLSGLHSTCLALSGLDSKVNLGPGGNVNIPYLTQLDICVSDAGVITAFSGVDRFRTTYEMELTAYSPEADPGDLQPIAGYAVVDVPEFS